ncbi:hypothetical protein Trydic_g5639 [Trypoxylus dichotomus]
MYELLNLCMPFEIRFMGSCIEEIGKHSYQELRGLTIIANDVEKLSKDNTLSNGLLDESTRSRVLLYISLLSTRNCLSANWLFKKLFRTAVFEDFIVKGNCKDENLQSELLLLLTMSLHHPAFTFDQKTFFGTMLIHLIEQREGKRMMAVKPNAFCYPPGFGYPPTQIIPLSHLQEEKFRDAQWLNRQNGIQMFYGIDQLRALKLEGENSLHCSTSSSNSSLNQSPPQTPTATLIPPHGPGRGGGNGPAGDAAKSRMNGMPPPFMAGGVPPPSAAAPPMCESTPPPPFSNCTVPYSNNYPSHVTLTAIPNSVQQQHQQPQQQQQRNPTTCCNCGAIGHSGADCTAQTIEDITQKAYSLEYSPLTETDK